LVQDAQTLNEALDLAADRHPSQGISIFDRRGRQLERRTYPEIRDAARLQAAQLSAHGVHPGDRVMISLPTSWDWLDAWLGAVVLGALPVALAPAGVMGSSKGHTAKVEQLVKRIEARTLIAGANLRAQLLEGGFAVAAAALITPEELAATPAVAHRVGSPAGPDDIAFLQFTSGSTGLPRAVMIRHRSVLHNCAACDEVIGAPSGATIGDVCREMVSWLPLHHDMGLVGCLLLSIRRGLDLFLMNPATFLARPQLWLETLAGRGPTFSQGPNFGYQLARNGSRPAAWTAWICRIGARP
jgi:fatty-acyl-CoA synthase